MTPEAIELRSQIEDIKYKLNTNQLSYEEARELAQPTIDKINAIGAKIAKEFKKKPVKLNFTGLMR